MRNLVSGLVSATASICNRLGVVALGPQAGRARRLAAWALCFGTVAILISIEMGTDWLQSHILSAIASKLTFYVQPARSATVLASPAGPYDRRLGYSLLPAFRENLRARGFEVEVQARPAPLLEIASELTLFPVYREKAQAGLQILDRNSGLIFARHYPERVYPDFESIPSLIVESLLFIESRELLDPAPRRNPAVEWDRLVQAFRDFALQPIRPGYTISGGSTLATQLEKLHHSPGGRTTSAIEKLRQMASASLRAYRDGEETTATRKQIICDYLNSLPLASQQGFGEVTGLGDGLWAWFGADFVDVNRLLREAPVASDPLVVEKGIAYRQVLTLLLAIRKPSTYLREDWAALTARVDAYLRLFSEAGFLQRPLRDAALNHGLMARNHAPAGTPRIVTKCKVADFLRVDLQGLLGLDSIYDLDRLDLTVRTTVDGTAASAVTDTLKQLSDPSYAFRAGIMGPRLLSPDTLDSVIYSFSLFERTSSGNLLRVQVDSLDQPLNVNQGTKLELGSTAKLRTLATYLEVVSELHGKYSSPDLRLSKPVPLNPEDRLSQWARGYLASAADRTLPTMVDAAMNRTYSASPAEGFFTGGGLHQFANFDAKDDGRLLTVREAFQRSVNLVFIRLMRDLVNYYIFRSPGASPAILQDENDAARWLYLKRFADWEGKKFLRRFYVRYAEQAPDRALDLFLGRSPTTARRLAVIHRFVRTEDNIDKFEQFVTSHSSMSLSRHDLEAMYGTYGPGRLSLNDRGYLAGVHPLELWVLEYLHRHPAATLEQVEADSAKARQEVYRWLFKPGRKRAQDLRIRTLLEIEAFEEIYRAWKRLGYPFGSLVPSYATAIGSSGDNPAALAELAGIILHSGMRYPPTRIEELRFGAGTPFETVMCPRPAPGQQVLSPLIAGKLKQELFGVVEHGTAQRAFRSVVLPNGSTLEIGGKTGTGDNRLHTDSSGEASLRSQPLNRTAAFVFFIGDCFFGAIVAYVPGPDAGSHHFTSALPVQVFKQLVPKIQPILAQSL